MRRAPLAAGLALSVALTAGCETVPNGVDHDQGSLDNVCASVTGPAGLTDRDMLPLAPPPDSIFSAAGAVTIATLENRDGKMVLVISDQLPEDIDGAIKNAFDPVLVCTIGRPGLNAKVAAMRHGEPKDIGTYTPTHDGDVSLGIIPNYPAYNRYGVMHLALEHEVDHAVVDRWLRLADHDTQVAAHLQSLVDIYQQEKAAAQALGQSQEEYFAIVDESTVFPDLVHDPRMGHPSGNNDDWKDVQEWLASFLNRLRFDFKGLMDQIYDGEFPEDRRQRYTKAMSDISYLLGVTAPEMEEALFAYQ